MVGQKSLGGRRRTAELRVEAGGGSPGRGRGRAGDGSALCPECQAWAYSWRPGASQTELCGDRAGSQMNKTDRCTGHAGGYRKQPGEKGRCFSRGDSKSKGPGVDSVCETEEPVRGGGAAEHGPKRQMGREPLVGFYFSPTFCFEIILLL